MECTVNGRIAVNTESEGQGAPAITHRSGGLMEGIMS